MASSDPELKDGFPFPVWMKNKPTKDFETFAASPPPPEDSFFYIRYPKTDVLLGKKLEHNMPNIVSEPARELSGAASYKFNEKDWSKHTKPCQDVLQGIAPMNTAAGTSGTSKPKPADTDDGFKGEGAACGKSVVKVAQMMSSTRSPRGFTVASPEEEAQSPEAQHYNLMARRGSKSLPVTPAHSPNSSPTSRRKKNYNRYFTSPFEPVDDASQRSWLTMALLGFKKDLAGSSSTLAEEDAIEARLHGASLAESVESLGPAPQESKPISAPTQQPKLAKPLHAFRPKPTELREMNFWSPTSM